MNNYEDKNFQGAVVLSIFLHIILIGGIFFSVPSLFDLFPEKKSVFTFEIFPISEIANVKNETKVATKKKEGKKIKQVKKQVSENSTQKPKPTPISKKKIEKKIQDVPAKKMEISSLKKVTKKKKETPKQKPRPKEKKEEITKKDEDTIDPILKNLKKNSEGSETKTSTMSAIEKQQGKKYSKGEEYDEDSPLSITERSLLKHQLQKNWRPPIGAPNLEDVIIRIYISVDINMEISNIIVKEIVCPQNSKITCDLVLESVIRTIRQASPLENLLPERYDHWKGFHINFQHNLFEE